MPLTREVAQVMKKHPPHGWLSACFPLAERQAELVVSSPRQVVPRNRYSATNRADRARRRPGARTTALNACSAASTGHWTVQ
jgi:hypothetical protein